MEKEKYDLYQENVLVLFSVTEEDIRSFLHMPELNVKEQLNKRHIKDCEYRVTQEKPVKTRKSNIPEELWAKWTNVCNCFHGIKGLDKIHIAPEETPRM